MSKTILMVITGGVLIFGFLVTGVLLKQKLSLVGMPSSNQIVTPTLLIEPSPTPSVLPTPTLTPTKKPRPTTIPTKKPTATSTPSSVSTTPSCPYAVNVPSGAIKVLVTSKTNYAIPRKIIEITAQAGCKSIQNNQTDKTYGEIWASSGEVSFSTLAPGPYAIKVGYDFDGYGSEHWTGFYNADAVSGQVTTVTVELP